MKTLYLPSDPAGLFGPRNNSPLTLAQCRAPDGTLDLSKVESLKQWCADRQTAGVAAIDAKLLSRKEPVTAETWHRAAFLSQPDGAKRFREFCAERQAAGALALTATMRKQSGWAL